MNSGFECNVEEVFNKFMELTASEMEKATKKALTAGAAELVRHTKSNLTASLNERGHQHWYNGKIIVYNNQVEDAVMQGKGTNGDFEEVMSKTVHIMGKNRTGSGTYRTRFLEKGTKERYATHARNKRHELVELKKPKHLGRINGKWFFKNAQNEVFPNLPDIYMREIDKAIDKINKTKI